MKSLIEINLVRVSFLKTHLNIMFRYHLMFELLGSLLYEPSMKTCAQLIKKIVSLDHESNEVCAYLKIPESALAWAQCSVFIADHNGNQNGNIDREDFGTEFRTEEAKFENYDANGDGTVNQKGMLQILPFISRHIQ